jgi:TolA-binding protein
MLWGKDSTFTHRETIRVPVFLPGGSLSKKTREVQGMKRLSAVVLGLLLALAVSCQQKETTEEPTPAATPEGVQQQAGEVMESAKTALSQTMDEYVQSAQAQLDKLQGEIHELEAKAQNASAETKAEMEKGLAELKMKAMAVQDKLTELKGSGSDAWKDLKGSMDEALGDLEKSYENVRGHLHE